MKEPKVKSKKEIENVFLKWYIITLKIFDKKCIRNFHKHTHQPRNEKNNVFFSSHNIFDL